ASPWVPTRSWTCSTLPWDEFSAGRLKNHKTVVPSGGLARPSAAPALQSGFPPAVPLLARVERGDALRRGRTGCRRLRPDAFGALGLGLGGGRVRADDRRRAHAGAAGG